MSTIEHPWQGDGVSTIEHPRQGDGVSTTRVYYRTPTAGSEGAPGNQTLVFLQPNV